MIVEDSDEWQQLQQERREVDEQERDVVDRAAAWRGYYERLRDWEAEKQRLALDGDPPPPEPDPPTVVEPPPDARHALQERRRGLRDREKQLRAQLRPQVERAAAEKEGELRTRAESVVADLLHLAGEYDGLVREVRATRAADDSRDPNRRPSSGFGAADRTRSSVSAQDVVDAVREGRSLLELGPPPTQQAEDQIVAGDVDPTGTGPTIRGLTPNRAFGQQPELGATNRGAFP